MNLLQIIALAILIIGTIGIGASILAGMIYFVVALVKQFRRRKRYATR